MDYRETNKILREEKKRIRKIIKAELRITKMRKDIEIKENEDLG